MGSRNFRYRFGENLPGTSSVTASKTLGFQPALLRSLAKAGLSKAGEIGTVAAPRLPTAGRATRELLDVNIQQKPAVHTLDAIEH